MIAPKTEVFDVVVIGGGGAGIAAATSAARWGAKVLLVEKSAQTGGDCTWTGCVPSKALIKCARVAADVRSAASFGVLASAPSIDFNAVRAHWQTTQQTIYKHDDSPEVLAAKGVEVRTSTEAVFVSPNVVELRQCAPGPASKEEPHGGPSGSWVEAPPRAAAASAAAVVQCRAAKFILCVGAHPVLPYSSIEGLDTVQCVTSDTLWSRLGSKEDGFGGEALPAGLVVLGGGPIGCELAQAFARLGTKVTLVGSVLPREAREARELVEAALKRDGVTVRPGRCKAIHVEDKDPVIAAAAGGGGGGGGGKGGSAGAGRGRTVRLVVAPKGSADEEVAGVPGDVVLCALGRSSAPSLDSLGLDKAGVTRSDGRQGGVRKGQLVLDQYLRCAGSGSVFACGDCAGGAQFTHLAGYQGSIAAWNATMPYLAWQTAPSDVSVPRCTFTEPEVASVGFTTVAQAVASGHADAQETKVPMSTFDRAVCEGSPEGFVSLVHKGDFGQLLGCTVAGAGAGELVAELAVVRKNKLGLNHVATTMHPYPSLAFGLQVATANQMNAGLRKTVAGGFFSCFRWCCCGPIMHGN